MMKLGPGCLPKQYSLSLMLSTGWFQELIQA